MVCVHNVYRIPCCGIRKYAKQVYGATNYRQSRLRLRFSPFRPVQLMHAHPFLTCSPETPRVPASSGRRPLLRHVLGVPRADSELHVHLR